MRVLLQRVTRAEVRVAGAVVGRIGCGFLALVGFTHRDGDDQLAWMADAKGDMLATIKFDDAQTSPAAMIKATTGQGYPAEISKPSKS